MIEVPGFQEAVLAEIENRETAFFPVQEDICGLPVESMNLEHFSILSHIRSPFICGLHEMTVQEIDCHIAQFIWVISPHYDPTDTYRRDELIAKVAGMNREALAIAIVRYVKDAMMDAPGGGGNGGAPKASFVASYVHVIASTYHWPEFEIRKLPLRRLFQYVRLILRDRDPQRPLLNPSDEFLAKWTEEESKRLAAEREKEQANG